MTTTLFGRRGEELAAAYLSKKGYKIIEKNFRTRNGEIDLVTVHNNILVFIEVKTRSSSDFGTPFEAITPWKLKALMRAVQFYKLTHRGLPELMRIDAVSVDLSGNERSIEHLENITGF